MKVSVPCPLTGKMVNMTIEGVKSKAEAEARAKHRLKKMVDAMTEAEKAAVIGQVKKIQAVTTQMQLTIAEKVLRGLKNNQLDIMNLEALTRLMQF